MKVRIVGALSAIILLSQVNMARSEEQTDPYLWLEEVRGEKALEWVKARNEATLEVLKAQPGFQETYDKALEILNSNVRIPYPQIRGEYLYNFWQDEKNERGLWRRTTLEQYRRSSPQWEVLLDVDQLCRDEGEQWVFKGASGLYPDYDLFLVQLSRGGGDAVVVREFDANAKQFVKDGFYLPEAKSDVSWRDRNSIYVGTDFGAGSLTESGYPRIAKLWKRGTPLSSAEMVFEGDVKDVATGCATINTPERRYDVIHRGMTFYTSNTYVIEDGRPLKIEIPDDADFGGFFKNQMLARLKSDWTQGQTTYKQGALIGIDYDKYLKGDRTFSVIVEPNDRSNVVSYAGTRDILLVLMLNNVRSELHAFRLKEGRWVGERVDTPELGTLGIVSTDERSNQYFLSYQGFLTPTSLYHVSDERQDEEGQVAASLLQRQGNCDGAVRGCLQGRHEGSVFRRAAKEDEADGTNPTLLYGYGGFEIEMLPGYSATTGAAWLSKGGVYVLANIRGGGEFGPAWHQAALKENRQRAYDDFAAVAEDLIKRKITSPQHLGIMGGSNGGLLMGVELTQRPDLYNGVVCLVPLLDMKRYNKLLAGASWVAEYGNPDVPEEWAYISKYSPYHNVRAEGRYPRVFFYTSTADDRVHPGHARKMAARMEEMGHKVYYYENLEGGHAAAATNKHQALRTALTYCYLWMQLK